VIPRYHLDKLLEHGGEEAVLDPMINIALARAFSRIRSPHRQPRGGTAVSTMGIGGSFEPVRPESLPEKGGCNRPCANSARPGVRSSV